jgi:hypothetical protein
MMGPDRRLAAGASIFICLGLAVCVAPTSAPPWVKAGADHLTIEREVHECEAQSNDAFASERAIIDEKVGLSFMLQGFAVIPLQRQILLQEAAEHAKQVFNDCMRANGFTKGGDQLPSTPKGTNPSGGSVFFSRRLGRFCTGGNNVTTFKFSLFQAAPAEKL